MKHGDKAKAKSAKAASKTSAAKNVSTPRGDNGKTQGRGTGDNSGFSNPLVASAFKRAIKKFPTAFRRLTD